MIGVIDIVYSARGQISPIYLADAALEAALLAGWIAVSSIVRVHHARRSREVGGGGAEGVRSVPVKQLVYAHSGTIWRRHLRTG